MLIPATISLILSTILLNLSLLWPAKLSLPQGFEPVKVGRVMGVASASSAEPSETAAIKKVIIEQNENFNKAIVKVIEEAKALSLPSLPQLKNLASPLARLPENQNRLAEVNKIEYDLPAENGAILNCQNNNLYFAKRSDRQWPIASITKLFTAYTFLDYNPGWETSLTIKSEDKRNGGKIYLFPGDRVKVRDLFYFSLVGSDNTATAALVRSTGLSEAEFVEKINLKIKDLGLINTRLIDPIGLLDGNISTAREVAEFARVALANPEISQASLAKNYKFTTEQGKLKSIAATNELLASFPNEGVKILGGKTGFVNSAGYCFVGQFANQEGDSIVTVILGASSDSSRFALTKKLVELYYSLEQ